MDETQKSEKPQKRGKRSRAGCLTCRSAKVKCDENIPTCTRCSRLSLHCQWAQCPVPLRERRRGRGLLRDREKDNWVPPDIIPKEKNASPLEPSPDGISFDFTWDDAIEYGDTPLLGDNQIIDAYENWGTMIETCDGPVLNENELFDAISASFSEAIMCPSPITDLILGTNAVFAGLPSIVELTRSDREALDHFQKDPIFGTKNAIWSTHSILLQIGSQSPMTLHLILAASLAEIRWKDKNWNTVRHDADKHYDIGKNMFMKLLSSPQDEPNHVVMLSAFWFMFLHQRRRLKRERSVYRELSSLMKGYVQTHRLDQTLSTLEPAVGTYLENNGGPSAALTRTEVTTPAQSGVLARLTIWLFWADTQSCFQGGGGSLAQVLLASSPERMANIHERSRSTFERYWGTIYPADEIRDDIQNASSLELLHYTWVVVQEINEAIDCACSDQEKILGIGKQIDSMRQRFSSVFRLTDTTGLRDRLVGNADWAVSNFYALCVYFFRWSRRPSTTVSTFRHEYTEDPIVRVVATLLSLIQRALASGPRGQLDILQWPLFWAGTETDDLIYREWILDKLVDPALRKALEIVYLEQPGGTRLGLDRIREICQEM